MEESMLFSVMREKVSVVTELNCVNNVKSTANAVEELLLECEHPILGKNKKKKKKHNGTQSPRLDFNSYELLKVDKEKTETKESAATQCSNIIKGDCFVADIEETNGDAGDTIERLLSSPQKSALRGAYEKLGFGPRPKMHVKWASSVWEPPSSIISHTVNKNQPKKSHSKKDMKHGHHGRSNHNQNRKKQGKKKPQLTTSRNFVKGDKVPLPDGTTIRNEIFLKPETVVTDVGNVSAEHELGGTEAINLRKKSAQDASNFRNSACAVSLLGYYTPCSLVYGQAM